MVDYERALRDAELEHAGLQQELKTLKSYILQTAEKLGVLPNLDLLQEEIKKSNQSLSEIESVLEEKVKQYYQKINELPRV